MTREELLELIALVRQHQSESNDIEVKSAGAGTPRRLNHVDSVTANRELRGLVQGGLIEQQSTRRWAHYTLNVSEEVKTTTSPRTDEEKILTYVREHGSIKRAECQHLLGITRDQARYLLGKMWKRGILRREGEGKGTRYYAPLQL